MAAIVPEELLPARPVDFNSRNYWDKFFANLNSKAFEWYGSFAQLQPYISTTLLGTHGKLRVLVIGCGNSEFSSHLYLSGVRDITNVDFSPVVITEMRAKCPHMKWLEQDFTAMSLPDNSFDVVVDKGSLDALMSADDEISRIQAQRLFSEVSRVLVSRGTYLCISLCQDYILKTLVQSFATNWSIDAHMVQEMKDNPLTPFVLLVSRGDTGLRVHVDATEQPVTSPATVSAADFLQRVADVQSYHEKRYSLQELRMDRFETLDFFADLSLQQSAQLREVPKYSVIVYDFVNIAERLCAAFFVPQGRESDYQFSTAQGLKEVAIQAECCRLLVIRCNRPHALAPMPELQAELSPLLMSLKPKRSSAVSIQKDDFPFLALQMENAWCCIQMGSTALSGDYCVEEQELVDALGADTGVLQRRLIFLQNQSLVQTEVQLRPAAKKKKGKKKTVAVGSGLELSSAYLDDHHRAFLACLLLSPVIIKKAHNRVHLAMVGMGGGALVMQLQRYLPQHHLDVIELEPEMQNIAEQYFGLQLSERSRVLVEDGLEYLRRLSPGVDEEPLPSLVNSLLLPLARQDPAVDAVLIDVDCKNTSLGITAPPPAFLEPSLLRGIHSSLLEGGLLLINVAAREEAYTRDLCRDLREIFQADSGLGQVYQLRPAEETVNAVVVACKGAQSPMSMEQREELLRKWTKSVGDDDDRLNLKELLALLRLIEE